MKLFPIAAMLVMLALPFSAAVAQDTIRGSFPVVKLKTFDGEKFVFPSGMQGSVLNIVFLNIFSHRLSCWPVP